MNRFYSLGLVFFINLVYSSTVFSWCWSEDCKKAVAFDEQMRYFTQGHDFWEGTQNHVENHLLKGVKQFQKQYPGAQDVGCLTHSELALEQVLSWLRENKEALIDAYNAQGDRMQKMRNFDQGLVFDVSERLKGLADLTKNPFCSTCAGRDDLQKLYDVADQRENIKTIQTEQMQDGRLQHKRHEEDDDKELRQGARKREEVNSFDDGEAKDSLFYHVKRQLDSATQNRKNLSWTAKVWTSLRAPRTWSPSYVVGVVVLGVAVTAVVLRNKIDAWLLKDDESNDLNTQRIREKLDQLEQRVLQKLRKPASAAAGGNR